MLPETIFTVETMAEHDEPSGSNPHTVGYFLSAGDAEYARRQILSVWPNATIQEYPIGTLLSDGSDCVGGA